MIAGVVLLALVVGVLVLLGSGAHHRAPGRPDAHTLRRLFQYAVLYALLVVVAVGVTGLAGRLFGSELEPWEDPDALLARSLSFVLVGLPLAAALGWWTWRRHRVDGSEADSGVFVVYLTVTALTGAFMLTTSLQPLISAALKGTFDGRLAGGVLAWGALWLGHWVLARRSLDDERGSPHLLVGSLIGLALGSAGLVMTLGGSLDLLMRPGIVGREASGVADGVGLLVAGALVWVRYWATTAIHLPRRAPWFAFVLLAGVGGGLLTALVGASRLLWSMLVWFAGEPADPAATLHFDSAAVELAVLAVGVLAWWYHRAVLGASVEGRTEVQRVYEYLISGIGLVAAAIGAGAALVGLIEAVTPGVDVGMAVVNTVLASVTLLVVGVPVWWFFWRRVRASVASGAATEVASPTRRAYLVVLFGAAGVAAVIALITVASVFFQDVVNGQLSATTLRSMRYGLGTLLAATAVSTYHWSIYREDRAVGVPHRPRGPRSIILVGAVAPGIDRTVSRSTGARVEVWGRLDAKSAPWDPDAVSAAVAGHDGADLLVIADGPVPQVLVIDPTGRRAAEAPEVGEAH